MQNIRLIFAGFSFGFLLYIVGTNPVPFFSIASGSGLRYLLVFSLGLATAVLLWVKPGQRLKVGALGVQEPRENHIRVDDATNRTVINSAVFDKLCEAIACFSSRYPEYKTKPPKLDDDIRPWLKSDFGTSDREAHVFGAIIAEHFKL